MHIRNIFICDTVVFCGLVEDDERLVQRPATHIGQRNNLDQILLRVSANLIVVHHLPQRIQQRP